MGNARLWARRGETGVTGNIYVGLHEFAEMAFVGHFLRPGDLFVDVGANAGTFTVLASKVCGARTIAIEPIASTTDRLRANVHLNSIDNLVEIIQCAVGAAPGIARMTCEHDTTNRIVLNENRYEAVVEVEIVTLDEICRDRKPVLIKIDVEGHADAVFRGAQRTLAEQSVCALIVEIEHNQTKPAERLMRELGFQAVSYDPWSRTLHACAVKCGNNLFIRGEMPLERVRIARPLCVKGIDI